MMKKIFMFVAIFMAASALVFTGCKEKEKNEDGDAYIISLTINNGGLSGTERYNGTVNKDNKTVVFNDVAAETDLAAVRFESKVSIGSSLDKAEYDFLQGAAQDATTFEQVVSVVPEFGNHVEYTVTINIKPAEQAPVIDRLVVKDDAGVEHTLTISNVVDGILLLGLDASATAEVVEVALRPARATYEFSAIANNIISATNPGTLTMNFMGLVTEYQLSFSSTPASGADFSKAIVHAWLKDEFVDMADQNTRSGDIDENYILLVNRAGDTPNPYLLRVDDVLANNVNNKLPLDVTGVEGGTHAVSAGRLSQGHIYVCNLQSPAVGEDAPLIVYHWASASAQPEKVLEWTGNFDNDENLFNLRLGDNMGLSVDESGNGYAFFAGQETGTDRIVRFTITNFTQFSEPTVITHKAAPQYYGIYNKVGDNEYLFKAVFSAVLWLLDKDANLLYELQIADEECAHATDFHIVEFNRGRYLIATNARRYYWYKPEALLVYDITEGMTNAEALKNFYQNHPIDPDSDDPEFPDVLPYTPTFKFEYSSGDDSAVAACSAICNAVVKDGKLIILSAAPTAGFVVVEVPMAQ